MGTARVLLLDAWRSGAGRQRRAADTGRRPLRRDPDRDRAGLVLIRYAGAPPRLELIWAGGYNARQVEAAVATVPVLRMEIVKRSDDTKGFGRSAAPLGRAHLLLAGTKPASR